MKNKKIDKGFEINYYNLSYRRKFIRTLWLIPWMILAICLMSWIGTPLYIFMPATALMIVTGFIQVLYNYKKWKEETNEK